MRIHRVACPRPNRGRAVAVFQAGSNGFFIRRFSFGVVENHPERVAMSAANAAHAMAKVDAVDAARALEGTMVDREDHGVALAQRDGLGPRLHARTLLREHEFAPR